MKANKWISGVMVLAGCLPAWAQWESGSDGSDGAFNPAGSVMVDLSLAIPGDALTTPGTGNGVYDATRWVVCFKYTSITVPAGATITFGMHPSGAPVAWLATGSVTISGTVNLDGEDAINTNNPPLIPYYSRPGPGAFEGGQTPHPGTSSASFGLGPGSSPTNGTVGCAVVGGGASHATVGSSFSCLGTFTPNGSTYGSIGIIPLMGGSGGNSSPPNQGPASGGAGGGAILIASTTEVNLGAAASISVEGGGCVPGATLGGGGSGGAIRLRAEAVSLASGSELVGNGGGHDQDGCDSGGGNGRVRIEASTIVNQGTISGSQSFPGAPSVVFPASPPRLYITSICGQSVSPDPMWGIKTADVDLNSAGSCTVNIGSVGVPAGNIVTVRVIPARGNIFTVNSSILQANGTATANVTFPAGRSEIQLRTNW